MKLFTKNPVADKHLKVYSGLLLAILIPFALTLGRVNLAMVSPAFYSDPSPLGYTYSLSIFLIPLLMFFLWLLLHKSYNLEKKSFFFTVLGVTILGCILDFFFGYSFFLFPNTGAVLGIRLPAFSWSTLSWVPNYLPIEEFGFYILGGAYMLSFYLWGVMYWFRRYNHPNYAAQAKSTPRLIHFNFKAFLVCIVLLILGLIIKKTGPNPEGMPGYFSFLTILAFTPCMFFFDAAKNLINWRAFSFMSFMLLLVSLVYEATLGVPYGWWEYQTEQMLGYLITAWSNLPIEAVMLWIAAGFGTTILYEICRIFLYMERPARRAFFGEAKGEFHAPFAYESATERSPTYITNGIGLPCPRGPYVNTIGEMANFIVKAKQENLQNILDTYINQNLPEHLKYVAFVPLVTMTFAKLAGYALANDGKIMGQLPENDLVFWVPAIAIRKVFGIPIPSHLAMFPYCLYVDSPYGLCSGREVYGFQKNWAEFKGPQNYQNPEFEMSVLGFKEFNPEKMGGPVALLTVTKQKDQAGESFSDFKSFWEALIKKHFLPNLIQGLLSGVKDMAAFLINQFKPESISVSLKHFRDVSDPTKSCFSQVIEAASTIDQFKGGGFLPGVYTLKAHDVASDPLFQALGIELDENGTQTIDGFWVDANFTMGNGKVVQ